MKYIALLRGINVGGNNKIAMAELRRCFEDAGLTNVSTYINSGNVIFETDESDKAKLVHICEQAIEKQFGFRIICAVIRAEELRAALAHAPNWWGEDNTARHNAIFVIAPKTTQEIIEDIGTAKPEYESVAAYEPIIFWSAPVQTFSRTRYSKIVGTKAYKSITIRNLNTTKKLLELSA